MGMFKSAEMLAYRPRFAPREPVKVVPPAKIVLPYPPSLNELYFHRVMGKPPKQFVQKGPTTEGRKFMAEVGAIVSNSGQKISVGGVILHVWLYRPRKAGDLDNFLKAILDGITGTGWTDDSQVVEIHAYRHDDKLNPRVEILFEPAAIDAPLFANSIS